MIVKPRLFYYLFSIILFVGAFLACSSSDQQETQAEELRPLVFMHRDTMSVLVHNGAPDYFVYKGRNMGFLQELFQRMEKELDIHIQVTLNNDRDSVLAMAWQQKYDLVAVDYRNSFLIKELLPSSLPHSYSKIALLSHKNRGERWEKKIYYPADYHCHFPLHEIVREYEIGVEKSYHSFDSLVHQLNNEEIHYLLCDYNQAIRLLPLYSNIMILDKLDIEHGRRFLLNAHNISLNKMINRWLVEYKKSVHFKYMRKKYFSQSSTYINYIFQEENIGKLSSYDELIKKYAEKYGFNWYYVASIMYQESRFHPDVVGRGGSYGLMQMMPVTMKHYGVSQDSSVEELIHAGVRHLSKLETYFADVENEDDKLAFIAASYNAGRGHILDAQKLAAKYGENKNCWKAVSKYLILKSKSEYANDSVVRFGYFPGRHSVSYANTIMKRYHSYLISFECEFRKKKRR